MPFESITVQDFFNNTCMSTTSLPKSSIVAANADPLSMSDARRVFDGKRVVFAGDSAVRVIYRDIATLLVTGHRLCTSQVAIQNGEKLTPYINERRVRAGGRICMPDYIDERVCQWSSSSSLHYIYLPFLKCQEANELLRLIRGADLLIMLSVRGDMNQKLLEISPLSFLEHLDAYASNVLSLCRRIVEVTRSLSSPDADPLLIWLTPLGLSDTMTKQQKNEFLQIVSAGEQSAKIGGFQVFDQLNISLADGGTFANKHGYLSSVGMRLVTKLLAETAAKHWHRTFRLPAFQLPLSSLPLVFNTTADMSDHLNNNYP